MGPNIKTVKEEVECLEFLDASPEEKVQFFKRKYDALMTDKEKEELEHELIEYSIFII